MAFGIALQNNLDKVYARLQNSLFSFSSITPIKKYYVILGQVSRNTLQSITWYFAKYPYPLFLTNSYAFNAGCRNLLKTKADKIWNRMTDLGLSGISHACIKMFFQSLAHQSPLRHLLQSASDRLNVPYKKDKENGNAYDTCNAI